MARYGPGQRVGPELAWEGNGLKWDKILGEDHGMDRLKIYDRIS